MSATLCVAFGTLESCSVWATTISADVDIYLGMRTQFNFSDEPDDEDPLEVVGQVVHTDVQEDGSAISFLFAGEELPDRELQAQLDEHWMKLDEDNAHDVMLIVATAPPTAFNHDVLILVGDLDERDEDGKPTAQVWSCEFIPDDPLLPMFAQRLMIDVLGAAPDEDDEPEAEAEAPEGSDEGDAAAGDYYPDLREADPELNDMSRWPAPTDDGVVPAVTVYCAIVAPGVGEIAFWTPTLGSVTGFDMMAAGWELLSHDDFDMEEFRATQRLEVARRTVLDIRVDEDSDELYLYDFEIEDAASIPEDFYSFLPSALADHCRFAVAIGDVDDVISGWRDDNGSQAA